MNAGTYFTLLALIAASASAQTSSCLQCSSDDPGCDDGAFEASHCSQSNDSCYSLTLSGGFILERGCLADLSALEQAKCMDQDDHSCRLCSDAGCNKERWRKCHRCSSSSNSKCAFQPNRITFCENYVEDDGCFAKVVGNEVIRGCHSDLNEAEDPCEGNKYCISCNKDDSCNGENQDVLKTVTRCIQCKEGELRCIDGTAYDSECDEREDRCYIKMWRNGELDRGCVKKLNRDEQDRCNDDSDKSCYSCSGRQCNNHPWLRCFQCTPERNQTSCAEEQTNATLSYYCGSFDLGDRCYSKLLDFEVTRGCVSDLGVNIEPCEGIDTCLTCSTDACNSISEAYIKDAANVGQRS